jgi:hypothetical protein
VRQKCDSARFAISREIQFSFFPFPQNGKKCLLTEDCRVFQTVSYDPDDDDSKLTDCQRRKQQQPASLQRVETTPTTGQQNEMNMDLTKTKLYGKAEEKLLDEWYCGGLRETVRIDVQKQRDSRPKFFVKSQLFEAMKAIASDTNTPDGRVWVLCGRPMSGKTSAGRCLLEHAGRAFQIKRGLFISAQAGVPLVNAVSKHIGAPDTGDLEWVSTLFDALAGTERTSAIHGMWSSALAPFRNCGLVGPDQTTVLSDIGNEPPIVVFDSVRGDVTAEDEGFIEKVYQLAQLKRVYVFVLTDDPRTANNLCRMNGRQRIKPLPGFYTGNPTGEDDVVWTEDPWLVPDLSKLIFAHFPRIKGAAQYLRQDGSVNFVSDGTLPAEALQAANRIDKSIAPRQSLQPVGYVESDVGIL